MNTNPSFEKNAVKILLLPLDLFSKKTNVWLVIAGEENGFKYMELCYIDDSDELYYLSCSWLCMIHMYMAAIWWGTRGTCTPHFFSRGWHNMPCPPHFFLFRFCIWRGFKNKSDVCHVSCEELFMLDGRPHIVKLMLKQSFVWYHWFC